MSRDSRSQANKLVGKHVYAVRHNGSVVQGKLIRVSGDELMLEPTDGKARTKAILPLVLFDLLAIGTAPFGYGGSFLILTYPREAAHIYIFNLHMM
jgi:hypothetical protein